MVTTTTCFRTMAGWVVGVHWGSTVETHGPFRWRWVARIVAWLNDGIH